MVSTEPCRAQPRRRRLSVDDRCSELTKACLRLIGTKPWDEVSMADVAAEAGVSKPLLYHYFSTKSDLYLAAVRSAADELRAATRPDRTLGAEARSAKAIAAHLDWIDDNALAYRAILQGGISSDPEVQAVVEASRADVVVRLRESFGLRRLTPAQRIAFRGWVGFLEGACLDWLVERDVSKPDLAHLLASSLFGETATSQAIGERSRAEEKGKEVSARLLALQAENLQLRSELDAVASKAEEAALAHTASLDALRRELDALRTLGIQD